MVESRLTRILLRLGTVATLAFIYLPLILIALYAFNESVTQSWPIHDYTTKWFSTAYHDEGVRQARRRNAGRDADVAADERLDADREEDDRDGGRQG